MAPDIAGVYPLDPPGVMGTPVTAHTDSRCYCRPGCLASVTTGDLVVSTTVGWALSDHMGAAS